jgi:hypothetical protein
MIRSKAAASARYVSVSAMMSVSLLGGLGFLSPTEKSRERRSRSARRTLLNHLRTIDSPTLILGSCEYSVESPAVD